MRVVIDCRSVFEGMNDVGFSALTLAQELPKTYLDHEFVIVFGARQPADTKTLLAPNVTIVQVDAAMIDPEFEQIRLPSLLDELKADIYQNPCFSTPLSRGRTKTIAMIPHVTFHRDPGSFESKLRRYLDRWTSVSCEYAHAVVTPTEFMRREVLELYGRDSRVIDFIPGAQSRPGDLATAWLTLYMDLMSPTTVRLR